jgi:acetyltransferase-like isoleucine patch superfamily enzyme
MKALRTIGIGKAVKFVWFTLVCGLMRIVIFPQVRAEIMRLCGAKIGKDCIIGNVTFSNLYHYGFSKLFIGNRVFIGDESMLDVRGGISLNDDVTVSNRTIIVSHINVGYASHPLQKYYPCRESQVVVKNGAYIGTAAILLPGVTLGKMAVIGAGAVVTHNVPDGNVAAGIPARTIRKI